jgi:hypothetical protein
MKKCKQQKGKTCKQQKCKQQKGKTCQINALRNAVLRSMPEYQKIGFDKA